MTNYSTCLIPSYNWKKLQFLKENDDNMKKIEENYLLARLQISAYDLRNQYPLKIHFLKKKFLNEVMEKMNNVYNGNVVFSRYSEFDFYEKFSNNELKIVKKECYYDYIKDEDKNGNVEWYINFADKHLFGYYGGALFAQDEMMVAEMPILGSVRELLKDEKNQEKNPFLVPFTRKQFGPSYSTPCLIRNVERKIHVKIDKNGKEGRPYGLYGNNFMRSSNESIKRATIVFKNPEKYNVIAIEAPKGQRGGYGKNTITFILRTAYSGFKAAVIESNLEKNNSKTIIHTGFWGCGAYGGNKELMVIVQLAAAKLAKIDKLVFHTGTIKKDIDFYERGKDEFDNYFGSNKNASVFSFVNWIFKKKYQWGFSDGN